MQVPDEEAVDEAFRTCTRTSPTPRLVDAAVLDHFGGDHGPAVVEQARGLINEVMMYAIDWDVHTLQSASAEVDGWLRGAKPWLSADAVAFLVRYFAFNSMW